MAPKAVPMGEMEFDDDSKSKNVEETTLKICKMLGVSSEDLEKYGKEVK